MSKGKKMEDIILFSMNLINSEVARKNFKDGLIHYPEVVDQMILNQQAIMFAILQMKDEALAAVTRDRLKNLIKQDGRWVQQ